MGDVGPILHNAALFQLLHWTEWISKVCVQAWSRPWLLILDPSGWQGHRQALIVLTDVTKWDYLEDLESCSATQDVGIEFHLFTSIFLSRFLFLKH